MCFGEKSHILIVERTNVCRIEGENAVTNKMGLSSDIQQGEIIIYQTEDGNTRINVRVVDETVWLTSANVRIVSNQQVEYQRTYQIYF